VNRRSPVGLSHVASMAGVSERGFIKRMSLLLSKGRMMDLLRIETQARISEWLEGREATGESFIVMFRLSNNRGVDLAMYCKCRVDMSGDEPLIRVEDSFPSVVGYDKGVGVDPFVIELKDLETMI